ncbi:MAG TPA: inositol-3-phosphate synthase, partial [Nitrososphaeraceae archaeon]|nr:inositol-3-phosphate synthase [Nitrososphaeraceae archaeon]
MAKKIRVAIAGVGNCASALIQGIQYYRSGSEKNSIGLTAYDLAGYTPNDIEFVAAFDVSDSKVGRDLSEAIFSPPNNAIKITDVNKLNVKVHKGKVLDGVGKHLAEKITLSSIETANISEVLKDSKADILVNYLPVGSREATQFYAEQCLSAGVSFVNAIPVFIASESKWQQSFKEKNVL